MINEKRMLEEFFELVQIPCLSCNERAVADILTKKLTELGATVYEDDAAQRTKGNAGNLIVNFPGSDKAAPTIMFTAHMDCVAPCDNIKPQLVDGVLKSDGTTILGGDDKAGVEAIMEALRVLKENNIPHGDIQIVFSVCEEVGMWGAENIKKELIKADFAYCLDAGGAAGTIVNAAPGQNEVIVRVHGKTAHGGVAPEKGVNAIKAAAEIITKVESGRIDEETTCNIGTIQGGHAINIVPDLVTIRCDLRSRNQAKLDALTAKVVEQFSTGCTMEGIKIETEVKHSYSPYVLAEDSACVSVAKKAGEALGFPVSVEATGGGSDANYYNLIGIKCALLGVGMSNCHTCEEFLLEQDLYNSARMLVEIVKQAK